MSDPTHNDPTGPAVSDPVRRLSDQAQDCIRRLRAGEPAALVELRQAWQQIKAAGSSAGIPSITVLGSALEAMSEAWQRARLGGREHPDAPRLTQEALDLAAALARGEVPPGSGVLKDLCVRAGELTEALSRPAGKGSPG